MAKIETLADGLLDSLRDLHSAERQLKKELPKLEKKASNPKLKALISAHFKETETQVARLDKIAELMDRKLSGKTCKAMQGLIEEGREVLELTSENEALIDVLLVGAATRVEHYEMAAYKSAFAMATELGENEIAKLLEKSLTEESKANEKLCALCKNEILSASNSELNESKPTPSKLRLASNGSRGESLRLLLGLGIVSFFAVSPRISLAEADPQTSKREAEAENYNPDNSGRNVRDINVTRTTADDQAMSGSETEFLAEIRRKIVANDSLSTNGKNVKIIVKNETVTLRGPIRSLEEKAWIEKTAAAVVPKYRVINELEVTPG